MAEVTGDGGASWVLLESRVSREGSWTGVDVDLRVSTAPLNFALPLNPSWI